jgi:hypothetical protein
MVKIWTKTYYSNCSTTNLFYMTTDEPISKEAQEAADNFDIRGCAAHQGYLRGYIAGSKKVEELRGVIRELLPIAEEALYVHMHEMEFQKVKSLIDNAKKLAQ